MKVLRTFDITLDITDPNVLFDPNKEEYMLNTLRTLYVGKCFRECMILNITRLVSPYIKLDLPAITDLIAQVSLKFEAEVLLYVAGEVVVDARIVKIDTRHVFMRSDTCDIRIKYEKRLPIFVTDANIPVVVEMAIYQPYSKRIGLTATAMLPSSSVALVSASSSASSASSASSMSNAIIKLNANESSEDEDADFDLRIQHVAELERELSELEKDPNIKTKLLPFLKEAIYPFKKQRAVTLPKGYRPIQINSKLPQSLSREKANYVCRPIELPRHEPLCYVAETDTTQYTTEVTEQNAVVAAIMMANEYSIALSNLIAMTRWYHGKIGQYEKFWAFYMSLKQA